MAYMIGYIVGFFICVLALMVVDKNAVKEVDGHYTWNYLGLLICGLVWPLVLAILLGVIFDELLRHAVIINTAHRENMKKDQERTNDCVNLKKDQTHESNIFYE